jgi:hypothetical protein
VTNHDHTSPNVLTQESSLSRCNPDPVPLPVVRKPKEEPLTWRLYEAYLAGRRHPDPAVQLPVERIPQGRRFDAMRRVARDIELLMGLRVAEDEYQALPYSAGKAAERNGLHDASHGSRVLKNLERLKVIRRVPPLAPLPGKPDGTSCFQPYDWDLVALLDGPELPVEVGIVKPETGCAAVERDPVRVEVAAQPPAEVDEELVMDGTEPRTLDELRMVTPTRHAHVTDSNSPIGGGRPS